LDRQANEYKLFDFIARHFLAMCSRDSTLEKSIAIIRIGCETFRLTAPVRQDLQWLEIFPFPAKKIANLGAPLPLQAGESLPAKSLKMVSMPAKACASVTIPEIFERSGSGRQTVEDLMGLASQGLISRAAHGFKPTQLGIAMSFAFARLGFDFEDRWLADLFDDLANGMIEDSSPVMTALAAIGVEMTARAGEIEEVFTATLGSERSQNRRH
jgi:DNA topoisomerase IA